MLLQHQNIECNIDVRHGGDFLQFGPYSIIFVDEADFYIKNHTIEWEIIGTPNSLKDVKLIGIASLIGQTFLLGSAYFSPSETMITKSVLKVKPVPALNFKSLLEIAQGQQIRPDIRHFPAPTAPDLEEKVKSFFAQNK